MLLATPTCQITLRARATGSHTVPVSGAGLKGGDGHPTDTSKLFFPYTRPKEKQELSQGGKK